MGNQINPYTNETYQKKIKAFLNNELSADSKTAFEAEIAANPALQKVVNGQQMMQDIFAATGPSTQKDTVEIATQEEPAKQLPKQRIDSLWIMLIFLVLTGVCYMIWRKILN